MKKTCIFITSIVILIFFCCTMVMAAESEQDMVYVSNSNRESIYQTTQNESFDYYLALQQDGLQIVKESITPVYTIDMIDYAKTDSITVKPLLSGKFDDVKNQGNVFVAKTIMSNGAYGGNIMFYVENGIARFMTFSPSGALQKYFPEGTNSRFEASTSYADHAVRIKKILNQEDIVSPNDVKFILIEDIGQFFYVTTKSGQFFIPIGYQNTDASYGVDLLLTITDIKELAQIQYDAYIQHIARKDAWEKEHPGETYDLTGYERGAPVLSGCSYVDNILNIPEYLGINMNANQQEAPSNYSQIIIWAVITICMILFGCVVVVKLKKKANTATKK